MDNLADRSPVGRLEVTGGVLRYLHECNWKMFIENLNDTMHPMVAHESSAGTARDLWKGQPPEAPQAHGDRAVPALRLELRVLRQDGREDVCQRPQLHGRQFLDPFAVLGHAGIRGAHEKAYGAERARAILGEIRHNTVYYPSLTIKGAIQTIRVVRPIAVDRTLMESYTLRLVGAPDSLLERSIMYNRLINSPASVVGHDDMHCYRQIQEGLAAGPNEWVSLHRNYSPAEGSRHRRHLQRDERSVDARSISRLARGHDRCPRDR